MYLTYKELKREEVQPCRVNDISLYLTYKELKHIPLTLHTIAKSGLYLTYKELKLDRDVGTAGMPHS